VCHEAVGLDTVGREFVPCECAFPICRPCYEYIRAAEGGHCPSCDQRYKRMRGQPPPLLALLLTGAGSGSNPLNRAKKMITVKACISFYHCQ
jgi:hypothetical protein